MTYRLSPKASDRWPGRYCGRVTHALQRAYDRFNLRLLPSHVYEAEKRIAAGEAEYLGWDSRGRQMWAVTLEACEMVAVYNPESGHVATFMTPKMAEENCHNDVRRVVGKPKSFDKRRRYLSGVRRRRMEEEAS